MLKVVHAKDIGGHANGMSQCFPGAVCFDDDTFPVQNGKLDG